MKKIRRTRIRTETSRLVFIREQPAEPSEATGAHEICPTCGQPVTALEKPLPEICAEIHTDSEKPTRHFPLKKKGETE